MEVMRALALVPVSPEPWKEIVCGAERALGRAAGRSRCSRMCLRSGPDVQYETNSRGLEDDHKVLRTLPVSLNLRFWRRSAFQAAP